MPDINQSEHVQSERTPLPSDYVNDADLPVISLPQGERCTNLLCKGMYLNYGLPEDKHVTGDGNFWCGKTQTILGPDRHFVSDGNCRHIGRSCYEGRD